jgi:hypothetical protein
MQLTNENELTSCAASPAYPRLPGARPVPRWPPATGPAPVEPAVGHIVHAPGLRPIAFLGPLSVVKFGFLIFAQFLKMPYG